MEEQEEFVVFEVKIPQSVMPLVEYAARADGWSPTLPDGAPNPESAAARIFAQTVRQATSQAINALAAERANQVRQQTVTEMTELANKWQAAMLASGQ